MRECCVLAKCTVKIKAAGSPQVLKSKSWCGRDLDFYEWAFEDAQHLALVGGGSVETCKDCVKSIINELSKELD